jgi:hypothetical protein
LIGAIAGDIIGSVYEFGRTKSKEFPLFGPDSHFTDDTVLTIAVAEGKWAPEVCERLKAYVTTEKHYTLKLSE